MSKPFFAPLRCWFYPLGNTPAANLLRETRFEVGHPPINILLLGCGDPRSILYTIWYNEDQHQFEFSACDYEPAVLARNIVLFAALAKDGSDKTIKLLWNVFYHLYIPTSDACELLGIVDSLLCASESLEMWQDSIYGKALGYTCSETLNAIRKQWKKYRDILGADTVRKKTFNRQNQSKVAELRKNYLADTTVWTGTRAAGARLLDALRAVPMSFENFWKTGVVGGSAEDLEELKRDYGGEANPLFAASSMESSRFLVHYGTDPLMGFHLEEAFESKGDAEKLVAMTRIAKLQFGKWCRAYHKAFESKRCKIWFHCGDAIAFCYATKAHAGLNLRLPSSSWNPAPIEFDSSYNDPGQGHFDIIDLSNLLDHVGLLNILPAAAPLLSRKASSVLFAESLLQASEQSSHFLESMLFADVSTACMLLGLAPVGHLCRVSNNVAGREDLFLQLSNSSENTSAREQRQYRTMLSWKVPANGGISSREASEADAQLAGKCIEFKADDLAEIFFGIYLKMFDYEDWSQLASLITRQRRTQFSSDLRFYNRASLILLITHARSIVATDWEKCIQRLYTKIEQDNSLTIGANQLQELVAWLTMCDLPGGPLKIPTEGLDQYKRATARSKSCLGIIFKGVPAPKVLHVALVVPRRALHVFTSGNPEKLGTPLLHMTISNLVNELENSFFAVNACFGSLKLSQNSQYAAQVQCDEGGWFGSADLIVTCVVPAYSLLSGSTQEYHVGLAVSPIPSNFHFKTQLGPRMIVYEAALEDKDHVWLLEAPPGFQTQGSTRMSSSSNLAEDFVPSALAELGSAHIVKSLTVKTEFPQSSPESTQLGNKAAVTIADHSPCSVSIRIADLQRRILFPFPIDAEKSLLRVARASSWVEVKAPVSSALCPGGFSSRRFPIATDNSSIVSWAGSYIDFSKCTRVDFSQRSDWLSGHLGQALSETERITNQTQQDNVKQNYGDTDRSLLDLKESIGIIFAAFAGVESGRKGNVFQLSVDKDCDTIIIASAAYYNPSTSSITLDAFVVPIVFETIHSMTAALNEILATKLVGLTISKAEELEWKRIMPSLVEHCRQNWSHNATCAYLQAHPVKVSTEHGGSPICRCGQGKMLQTFPKGRAFKGLAQFATRIAIAPIAAVPYVENLCTDRPSNGSAQSSTGVLPEQSSAASRGCENCGGKSVQLKACKRCHSAYYCNRECQKAAWKLHKKDCKNNVQGSG